MRRRRNEDLPMNLRRALIIAACLLPAAPAAAQSPWPQQAQPAQSPWPQTAQPAPSPWTQPAQPAEPPCYRQLIKLRDDAQKKAGAIQAASKNRPNARVVCGLFTSFVAAEGKLIKYASESKDSCGMPAQVLEGMRRQHTQTIGIRTKICNAATAQQQGPSGPSLSDALSAPIPDSANIKTGRGTYDTLTGAPLGSK
jgi:hypothetical protein